MGLASVGALTNFKTEKQIQIVQTVYNIVYIEEHTLSSLNRRIQEKISISEPTIRRVLEKLRENGFITAGSKGNENIIVSFNRDYGRVVMHSAPVSSNASAVRKSDREKRVQFPLIPSTQFNLNKRNVIQGVIKNG